MKPSKAKRNSGAPKQSVLALNIRSALRDPPTMDARSYDIFCIFALWTYTGVIREA